MLEKIGLPQKPSLRGNNWVLDASHCQGCSSQFTFLNRKHHCRRCGGIFCNSCTQHRMVLRGQGDSPVRICESCKKLEEAARFELRHGHKNRVGKGSSKGASRNVGEVLNQILANDGAESLHSGSGKQIADDDDDDANLLRLASDKSNDVHSVTESTTPEELRQKSLDEKNKYKLLKGEGKSAEALKAFKRAKELERQAAALELQLRKSRRKALASSSIAETQKNEEVSPESGSRNKAKPQKVEKKDDLTSELRELGWADDDIHDLEKKPATTSLEGELLSLIGPDSGKTSQSKASSGTDKSQIVALKKKALALKREGKLAEAKEELKRAKILEKQLEEQEFFLGEDEDSDDELSALMRSLDNDKQKGLSDEFDLDSGFDLGKLSAIDGDLDLNFEVTDDDLHDPEMSAALLSLGWTEEPLQLDESGGPQSGTVDSEALAEEIRNLKKEAVTQKRSGNMAEAMSLVKKYKMLEKDLDSLNAIKEAPLSSVPSDTIVANVDKKPAPKKSRLMVQKELLAVKKKALALKREGKLEEADEELKKGKFLEQQLEEMDSSTVKKDTQMSVGYETSEQTIKDVDLSSVLAPRDEEGDITDQDLHDPTYLSLLKNLGWQEEDNVTTMPPAEVSVRNTDASLASSTVGKPKRSKAEIQRELLGLKRKALALRRQGQVTEADEVLQTAKALEEQLAELEEAPKKEVVADFSDQNPTMEAKKQEHLPEVTEPMEKETQTPLKRPAEPNEDSVKRQVLQTTHEGNSSPTVSPENQKSPLQQEILAHKRKALALKREGKLAEAREELGKARLLERNLEDDKPPNPGGPTPTDVSYSSVVSTMREEHSPSTSTPQGVRDPPNVAPKKMSSHERFKLQRECLNHKRSAMKLRREGKTEEAEAELELARKLEAQLEEVSPHDSSEVETAENVVVEDLFDPQLLSALKAIGLQDAPVVSHTTPVKAEPSMASSSKNVSSSPERVQLEAQIKAEKVKALNLKRAGKQQEALDTFRRAKVLEKKLNSLPS